MYHNPTFWFANVTSQGEAVKEITTPILNSMLLKSFDFKESGWTLSGLSPLGKSNLLVGRNSTGKTRTLNALRKTIAFMRNDLSFPGVNDFAAEFVFTDPQNDAGEMKYVFQLKEGKVVKESLVVDGKYIIKRTKSEAMLFGAKINPPAEKLVVQARRDTAYTEIEALMVWAEGVVNISCADIINLTVLLQKSFYTPERFSDIVDKLTDEDLKAVKSNARKLEYYITEMKTIKSSEMKFVQIKERAVENRIMDVTLSNGMLRVLYILSFLEYIKHNNKLSLLLIDDLGEGLDYRRSTCLGEMVFEYCKNNGLQLIASSNDAFLMDVVDVADWHVLRRESNKVEVLNKAKEPELFRKFRISGLSNFDLFSSDFIDKYFAKQKEEKNA